MSTFCLNVILRCSRTLLSEVIGDMLGRVVSRSRVTGCALFSWGRRFFKRSEVRRESGCTVYICQQQKSPINPRESGVVDSGCSEKTQEESSRFTGPGRRDLISPAPGMPKSLFNMFCLYSS